MPVESDSLQAYLSLAKDLYGGKISEEDLLLFARGLPPLHKDLLDQLAQQAESFSSTQPRRGWAIAQTMHAASQLQNLDLFLRSLATWYLVRACNHWTQPLRVAAEISSAREGFDTLDEAGWAAACTWQQNALPWTRPNFAEAARSLQFALDELVSNEFKEFIPHCRLALAYAQILIGQHDSAQENIRLSEETYIERNDRLNQARSWLNQASSFRRQDRFDEAFQKLEVALAVFEEMKTPVDQAKAHYQIALGFLLRADDLSKAVSHFSKAAELFRQAELDLWYAMCINNLGSVYLFTGELGLSDKYYQEAAVIFVQHQISGLLADNLTDHGEVNILRGRPQESIEQFNQAIAINEKLGSELSAAVSITNLGKAYGQSGRYQDALFYLEQSAERLKSLNSYLRLGTCEKYMALVWSQLGQPALTHEHLDRAIFNYERADQKALLSEVYSFRAAAFFQQGREMEAIAALKESLSISLEYGVRPQNALARRLLGEALTQVDQYDQARQYLVQAEADFSDMGMFMDQAASLIALGKCYMLRSEHDEAQAAFLQALQLSDGLLPEIEWVGRIALANLAESREDNVEALQIYGQALEAFAQIRQNFWQPALAGSYLQKPARAFDRMISLTARAGAVEDTFVFIEQYKASTLLGKLSTDSLGKQNSISKEIQDMEAEIRFLQDQLKSSLEPSLLVRTKAEYRQIRNTLIEKTQKYENAKARLERQVSTDFTPRLSQSARFDLLSFRGQADHILQKRWVAIDYYLIEEERLIINVVNSERCEVFNIELPERFKMALNACERARQNPELPTESDWQVLGKALIPELLAQFLTPETHLILSPHKRLHAIPWAALQPAFSSASLIEICIPIVVPALQSLSLLWKRKNVQVTSTRENGLVVGLSSFADRHRELPYVNNEMAFLESKLSGQGQVLAQENATWENLIRHASSNGKGLDHFSWLHIGSHFSAHAQAGRLSSLALWDGDIWLDKLHDVSPLPDLITLSACNGISSFIYDGEEHIDFPTTCLACGANSIVGSLWPILDEMAADFTAEFYRHYLSGESPAMAVSRTQREMIAQGRPASQWAGFTCIGVP